MGVDSIRPESVGEHSFGTTLIALLISKALVNQGTEVNQNTVVEMALLHDLPESIISDIPRTATELGGDLFKQAKREAERRAVEIISGETKLFGDWIRSTWKALEESAIEKRIVIGADMIDMLVHAISLEYSGISAKILDQFFTNSKEIIEGLKIGIIEDIFWDIHQEHVINAGHQGVDVKVISRS